MKTSSLKNIINQSVSEELNFYQILKVILFLGSIIVPILIIITTILLINSNTNLAKITWYLAVISCIVCIVAYLLATVLTKEIITKTNNLAIDYFQTQTKDILEKFLTKDNKSIIEKMLTDIQGRKIVSIVPEFKLKSIKKPQVKLIAKIDFKRLEYIFKKEAIILQGFEIKDEKVIMNYLINYLPYCFQAREFSLPLISLE
ncbi:hypothetical protein COT98_02980 [Candidatus Falkowbacteria bacterium CG10_big_fil_rev_8_21_14_0_10_39_9]|uniref:Uncharacterized protein n=1 Tax=Candidatus Falkowbacteria bacterium CG10_big_fil_rev_8_21_14_0_10_39_9 TaxID=1974566 RepID=A0A2M6WP37_9BACT|nr:MAG: hypothetical protein COT98_02980 [Candidatus Falkowbacteria bacterium CG10_big_fil_rev_8_21_14_0_10_39_9]